MLPTFKMLFIFHIGRLQSILCMSLNAFKFGDGPFTSYSLLKVAGNGSHILFLSCSVKVSISH